MSDYANSSLVDRSARPAKRCILYRNGDKKYPGKVLIFNGKVVKDFEGFLQLVSNANLLRCGAAHRLYSARSGNRITETESIEEGKCYVAAGKEKFIPIGYTDIQNAPKNRGKPKSEKWMDIEPVYHNREYQAAKGKIRDSLSNTKAIKLKVYSYRDYTSGARHISLLRNNDKETMDRICDEVQASLQSKHLSWPVRNLVDKDTGELVMSASDLIDNGSYIACPYNFVLSEVRRERDSYTESPLKNFSTSSPRGPPPKNNFLWDTRGINYGHQTKRPRTLPPLSQKGYKGSPNTSSVASNPEYKRRNRSQQNGGFHAKPVKHKRTPEKKGRPTDYDRDDGGVFKAKNQNRDTRGAKEVGETRDTKTDLPIDQVQAEEVKEYDGLSDDNDANLPSEVSLSRKPSDPPLHEKFDENDDQYDDEEDEKINSEQKNNNAKETTQKANSKQPDPPQGRRQADQAHVKKEADHGHGRKETPPPVQKKHSGTRGEFNNVSPLPGIQSNDKRASTPKQQNTNAWSDDGKKNAEDMKKSAEQIKKENEAATKIQAGVKGHQARKQYAEKKSEMKKEDKNIKEDNAKKQKDQDAKSQKDKENEAATKIQAGFRGHQTRKEIKKQKEEKEVNNAKGYSSGRSRDTLGNDEEEAAATKIQANYRGHKVRKEMNEKKDKKKQADEEEQAATKIQAGFRGHKARQEVKQWKEEEKAATKIQAGFRGHQVRKELKNKEGEQQKS